MTSRLLRVLAALLLTPVIFLSACSSGSKDATSSDGASNSPGVESGIWPRRIKYEKGELTLKSKPKRTVLASVILTGTLLATDVLVKASAATTPSNIADNKGFLSQWSPIAKKKGVDVLCPSLKFNKEAFIAANPGPVIIASSGADNAIDHYKEMAVQYLTTVVDYSKQTWQELSKQLREVTGQETNAKKATVDFNKYVAGVTRKIEIPEGNTAVVPYNGPGEEQGVAKRSRPQGRLLEKLGFRIVEAPAGFEAGKGKRDDLSFVTHENLTRAVSPQTVFLLTGDQRIESFFLADLVVVNMPAVKPKQVYGLGFTSFRIDYYSDKQITDAAAKRLGD